MRHRRAGVTAGTVDPRFAFSRRLLVRGAIALAVLWMAWAFAQEAWTASRLDAQAADLRQRNAALESQNAQYVRDIAAVQSGAASEEVARENGYARPGEHVYVVATPAPAAPSSAAAAAPASARPRVRIQNTSAGPFDGLAKLWSSVWHNGA